MKKLFSFLFVIFCVLTIGCLEKDTQVSEESIGIIIDADIIPTSFNESLKMRVKTEKMVFIICGALPSIPLSEEAFVATYKSGRKYVTWKNCDCSYRIK